MLKIYISIIFLLNQIGILAQGYSNHLDKYNLKGNIEFLFYDSYFPYEFEEINRDYNSDNNNYYISFNKKGNIDYYGLYTIDDNDKKIITSKVKIDTKDSENIILKDKKNNIIESTLFFKNNYLKGLPKSKKIYEYYFQSKNSKKPLRITEYSAQIDTLDIGIDILNTNPNEFSEAKHIEYSLKKVSVKIFNVNQKLTKKYIYANVHLNWDYNDWQDDIFEYEYDINDNILIEKSYNQKMFRHKNLYRYKYTYDESKNWTLKFVYDETLVNDNLKKVIRREVIYRKN